MCLSCETFVQWCWVKCILHAVAQDIHDIDARVRCRAGIIVASGAESESAGGTTADSGACTRETRWGAWHSGDGIETRRCRCLGRRMDGVGGRLIVMTRSGHDDRVQRRQVYLVKEAVRLLRVYEPLWGKAEQYQRCEEKLEDCANGPRWE